MINEYSYCPRLFYFEQVEGVFVHNEHTAEGAVQHKRVDREGQSAPRPSDDFEEPVVVRSITLFSEKHRVIAKLDLTEFGLSNRFSVISFRVYREGLLHLFFPAGQVQVLPAGQPLLVYLRKHSRDEPQRRCFVGDVVTVTGAAIPRPWQRARCVHTPSHRTRSHGDAEGYEAGGRHQATLSDRLPIAHEQAGPYR